MYVAGKRGLGRPRKIWSEYVKEDLDAFKFKASGTQDGAGWRESVKNSRLEPTKPCEKASFSKAG